MALGNINVSNTMKIEEEINNIVSDKWNNSITYNVGEYCIYKDTLWKCLLQNKNQIPEEGTYWTKVNIGTEIKSVNTKIGNTDISSIGDGTVTNSISTMNSNLGTNSSSNIFQLKSPDYLGISAYANYGGTEYSIIEDVFSGVNYGGYAWNFDTIVGETYTITLSNPANKKIFADSNEPTSEGTKSLTFTASSTVTKLGVLYAYNGGTTPNTKIQINVGSKSLDYQTYNGYSNRQLTDMLNALTYPNAGAHNSIYRGKNLGTSYTAEQKAQIQAGTFNDLYIGDYWVINGVTWRIAHFDYWLHCGDTECTKHHVVIVPDTNLYKAKMNDTNITTGAYAGSAMYTANLAAAKTTIENAFGSANILTHREYLANATKATADPTYESAGSWYDSTVELMNECMVYGSNIFHNVEVNGAIPTNYTIDKSQLELFRLDPSKICNRAHWWLRDVVSASYFARVSNHGGAGINDASDSYGVRPAFGIC